MRWTSILWKQSNVQPDAGAQAAAGVWFRVFLEALEEVGVLWELVKSLSLMISPIGGLIIKLENCLANNNYQAPSDVYYHELQ